jgi:hypothetical protein
VATLATLAGPGYPLAIAVCSIAPFVSLAFVLRSRRPGRARGRLAAALGAASID